MNNIVSLSGGKDSTAMLLMMLERNEPIHSVVFFDTGWEFPEMIEHVNKLEAHTGVEFIRLYPRLPFDFIMSSRPVRNKKTKEIHRFGYEWPSPFRRWCTREKMTSMNYYFSLFDNPVPCVGYAADETHRDKDNSKFKKRYPLIEYGITEADALEYCYSKGFDWGGLYKMFDRVSCYCCPLQGLGDLRKLRKHYPELWAKMLHLDALKQEKTTGFQKYKTVHDLERRFAFEDRQMLMFKDFDEEIA